MWVGGMTELIKISAMAAAYDIPVVPHASGPYSYHFVVSQANSPFQEYLANSPDGKSVLPVFGNLYVYSPFYVGPFTNFAQVHQRAYSYQGLPRC
jgi:L-alanine-DL-glutamate epimerase-like enolase superfamily enzyme